MTTKSYSRRAFLFILFFLVFASAKVDAAGWKAGVAATVIAPDEPIWMAGYAARNRPADSKIHDLWAKALALEDSSGNRSVLVTLDLLGLPKPLSDRIRGRIKSDWGLNKERIILSSSHTHSGPVLAGTLVDIYPVDVNNDEGISRYTAVLESKIIQLVSDAFQAMSPAELYAGEGITRFQINRRNNNQRATLPQTELKGPNDNAVPVIKITGHQGDIRAVVFGYACHSTTLDGYAWCGD